MASVQATLTASTPVVVPLPNPTGRITVTMIGGTPAETWVTVDGSAPVAPSTASNLTGQGTITGVLGSQVIMMPPLFGDHMVAPTLRLASLGTPTVQIEW